MWVINREEAMPRMVADGVDSYIEFNPINSYFPFGAIEFSSNQSTAIKTITDPSFSIPFNQQGANIWESETCDIDLVELRGRGNVLSVKHDGAKADANSEPRAIVTGGTAQIKFDIYPQHNSNYKVSVVDTADSGIIIEQPLNITPRKWNSCEFEFVPRPAGNWLSGYKYRRQILMAPQPHTITENAIITVKDINLDLICAQLNHYDVKLIFFNGARMEEVPFDYTGNGEFLFKVSQELPAGCAPSLSTKNGIFYGAYYLYYQLVSGIETNAPNTDVSVVLNHDGVQRDVGSGITTDVINEPVPLPTKAGNIIFDFTGINVVRTQQNFEKQYIFDSQVFSVYFYEKRLYIIHKGNNGFVAGAVFSIDNTVGDSARFAIQWSEPNQIGFKEHKGWCSAITDSGRELTLIDHYYDSTYDEGDF